LLSHTLNNSLRAIGIVQATATDDYSLSLKSGT
jgi:hypothetical protein